MRLMLNQDSRTSNNGRSSPHRHILLDQPGSDDSNSQQPGCSSSFGRPPPVSPGRSSPRSQALEGPTSRNKHADRMISQKKHSFLGKIRPGGYASLSSASGSGANERAGERRLENPPQNKNEGQMMGNGSSASLCVGPVRRDKPGPLCSKRFYNAHPTPSPVRSAPVLDSQKENRPTSKRTVSTRDVSSPVGDESILENSQPAKRPRMQMLPDKQKEYPNQDNHQQGNLEEAGKHPDFYKYSHWFQKVKIGNPQTSKEKTNDGNSKGMLVRIYYLGHIICPFLSHRVLGLRGIVVVFVFLQTLKMGKKKENLFRHGESEPEIIELSVYTKHFKVLNYHKKFTA